MTLADTIIGYQFWFEYGLQKAGLYVGIVSIGMTAITLLTVKGIYVPIWMFFPMGAAMVLFFVFLGYFLDTRNVMGRLISHQNRKDRNPEFGKLCENVENLNEQVCELNRKHDAIAEVILRK